MNAYYHNKIANFLTQSENEILGILTQNDRYDLSLKQKDAWIVQIKMLKKILKTFPHGSIIFEYTIPRVGGRIDNVILLNNTIFVIEFKVGGESYLSADATQVRSYAFDLANYHEESHDRTIVPILIETKAPNKELTFEKYDNRIYDVVYSNGHNLSEVFKKFEGVNNSQIPLEKWLNSEYAPTPTIIKAARELYNSHNVGNIKICESSENLTLTSDAVQNIIRFSKENRRKSICFITGVPGAGKTLAGLDIAIKNKSTDAQAADRACFLTGNQPLVSVLKKALAKDNHKNTGIPIGDAESEIKSFIQIIHGFRDNSLKKNTPPNEHVVIFDEAQRAWEKEKLENFLRNKKKPIINKLSDATRQKVLSMSEPELLIEYMNRHQDWAVIVCLVGGGQDINTGEAGIREWFKAIRSSYPDWKVYVSSKITDEEYVGNDTYDGLVKDLNCTVIDELHLSISLRSFRSEHVSNFIHHLLNNDQKKAKALYENINKIYPIFVTRDLNTAKSWVKEKTANTKLRHGLIASSKAKRLRADGIWVECKCKPEKWFLEDKENIKSSYYMEEVATEFDIQGLEIDYAIVGWDADYRYVDGKFEYYMPRGSKWQHINNDEDRRYLKNAYRVLLTRARQGFIIYIPKGDNSDQTRLCKFYDGVFDYLKEIGIEVI